MRYLYTLLYTLCVPLILVRLLWRARRDRRYAQRLQQRFGRKLPQPPALSSTSPGKNCWIHAVSLGEVRALAPLVREFMQDDYALSLTSTTPTGYAELERTYARDDVAYSTALLDLPSVHNRFHEHFRPDIALLMETEIWPNQLACCRARGVPSALINARLSESSARLYQRVPWVFKDLGLVVARSADDASRFQQLGVARVEVGGDLKYDMLDTDSRRDEGAQLRRHWGTEPVWIAGSTHAGEESVALEAHRQIRRSGGCETARLVLVPRHPERFKEVIELVENQGWKCCTSSNPQSDFEVMVVDAVGVLVSYYAAADVAFVGGSLVPVGGHNLYEPLAVGTPVITGTHLHNFEPMYADLAVLSAVRQVDSAEMLSAQVQALLGSERPEAINNLERFCASHGGASERIAAIVQEFYTGSRLNISSSS